MSEALSVQVEIVETPPSRLDIPKGTTVRQWRLAKLVVAPGSELRPLRELMIEAGYSEISADANATRQISLDGTQRAIQVIREAEARKLDNVRALEVAARAKIADKVNGNSASEQLLLGTWKTATELRMAGADEAQAVSEEDRNSSRHYILSVVNACLHSRGVELVTMDEVDAAVASLETA